MMPVNEKLRSRQMVDNLRKAVGCSHPLYHFVQSLKEVASGVAHRTGAARISEDRQWAE